MGRGRECDGNRRIATDIFSSFKRRFPMAEEVCTRCIPELPMVFTFGLLHKVYNRAGKTIMKDHHFFDFRSMLVEIGALGRVIDTTTNIGSVFLSIMRLID